MRFEVYKSTLKGRDGWRFRLRGNNNKIVAHGEHYTRRHDCLRAIARMRQDVPNAEVKNG